MLPHFDTELFKTHLLNGHINDARQYSEECGYSLFNLVRVFESDIVGMDEFYLLAYEMIRVDPTQCNRAVARIEQDRWTRSSIQYTRTLPSIIVENHPDEFRLFELVVRQCNDSILRERDGQGQTLITQIIRKCSTRGQQYTVYIPWIDALVRRGANVNEQNRNMRPVDHVCGLSEDAQMLTDYLLENGSEADCFVARLVDTKRSNCNRARLALAAVLLRKLKWVNKDVIRSIILPRVWETRLENVWIDPAEGGVNPRWGGGGGIFGGFAAKGAPKKQKM